MAKYHISKDGTPRPCGAVKGQCPYGEEVHGNFDNDVEARQFAEEYLEKNHGLFNETQPVHPKPAVTVGELGGPSAPVLARSSEFPGTFNVDENGLNEAGKHFDEITGGTVSPMIRDLALNMAASDIRNGHETRALSNLTSFMDLTGAYRIYAALVAGSEGNKV